MAELGMMSLQLRGIFSLTHMGSYPVEPGREMGVLHHEVQRAPELTMAPLQREPAENAKGANEVNYPGTLSAGTA